MVWVKTFHGKQNCGLNENKNRICPVSWQLNLVWENIKSQCPYYCYQMAYKALIWTSLDSCSTINPSGMFSSVVWTDCLEQTALIILFICTINLCRSAIGHTSPLLLLVQTQCGEMLYKLIAILYACRWLSGETLEGSEGNHSFSQLHLYY